MKIEKFNEGSTYSMNERYKNMKTLIEKFFGNDEGNMGNYDSDILVNNRIRFTFSFVIITYDELEILIKLIEYFRSFDNNCEILFRPLHFSSGGDTMDMIDFTIVIDFSDYDKLSEDLKIYRNSKKYNL